MGCEEKEKEGEREKEKIKGRKGREKGERERDGREGDGGRALSAHINKPLSTDSESVQANGICPSERGNQCLWYSGEERQ